MEKISREEFFFKTYNEVAIKNYQLLLDFQSKVIDNYLFKNETAKEFAWEQFYWLLKAIGENQARFYDFDINEEGE